MYDIVRHMYVPVEHSIVGTYCHGNDMRFAGCGL